ncbi:MAG: hypothetical protein GY715_19130 [Planctomycetes bacterium]|nr:hypothetical protein [Planctomycetota bacterium]
MPPTKRPARKKKNSDKARTGKARTSTKKRPASGISLLDAAAAVLAKSPEPMSCPEMVEAVLKAGAWKTRGRTPAATLSASIHREIKDQGKEARFAKAERGRFRLRAARAGRRGRAG